MEVIIKIINALTIIALVITTVSLTIKDTDASKGKIVLALFCITIVQLLNM